MSRKKLWILVPLVLVIIYLLGPRPDTPDYNVEIPNLPSEPAELERFINTREAAHKLRPDNEARIIWANDTLKQKTEYAIVYLHGFSASQGEGDPVHRNIAKKFGCNLYLSRLAEHGIDTAEQLLNFKAEALWESAKEAFAIASQLGNKVIVMGTSTGGTLALMLASTYPQVNSLVLMSPNIEIFDDNAWLLNNPWGLKIARLVTGSNYIFSSDTRALNKKYWNYGYRLEALVELEEMLETSMKPAVFKKISQPTLLLYYYRDKVHQDSVVRVDAMLKMFDDLGTPAGKKLAVAMPMTGNHVIGSYIKSKDTQGVERQIEKFLTGAIGLKPDSVR